MNVLIKRLFSIAVGCFSLCFFGGLIYADENTVSNVIDSSIAGTTSNSSVTTTKQKVTTESTIGVSNLNIVLSSDDALTGLSTLTDFYGSNLSADTKQALLKDLTSLVVGVISNGGFTLDSFKTAFIEILVKYGIEITEDLTNAIVKYAVHYLNDDFEQEDNETLLILISGSLGLMTTLFVTSQQGGVHRA